MVMKKVTRIRATVGSSKQKAKLTSSSGKIYTAASGTKFKLKGQTS